MASRNVSDLHLILGFAWDRAHIEYNRLYPDRPVFLSCTHRPDKEQNELYAQGRTTPGKKITNARAGQSPHNYLPALAFDVAFKNGTELDWNLIHFKRFAAIIKAIDNRVEWGGDWIKFKDAPHFQLKNWTAFKAVLTK